MEGKDTRITGTNTTFDPMVIGITERFNTGKVGYDRRSARRASHEKGLIDTKVVTIAMDEHDGLGEGQGFRSNCRAQFCEAIRIRFGRAGDRGEVWKDVRLLEDNDAAALGQLGVRERALQPGRIRCITFLEFPVTICRSTAPIVTADHMQRQKRHAAQFPTCILWQRRTLSQ